jgi:large exoprotein involved in heme utilization and adhesion
LQDLLLLRGNSSISSTAGVAQQGGNGGNITINVPNGFVVAIPNENSDISANAFTGTGGKVTINAIGIYGAVARSREDLVKLLGTNEPENLDPAKLPTSEITAISQTSPTLNGDVILNTPDTDPSRGLIELPTNLVDASQQIAQGCTPRNGRNASRFIYTGRGGIPENPYEPLQEFAVITNWVKPTDDGNQQVRVIKEEVPIKVDTEKAEKIVEAQGWVLNSRGEVELVAQVSVSNSYNFSNQYTSICK